MSEPTVPTRPTSDGQSTQPALAWLFAIVVLAQMVLVFVQAVTAGQFLSGTVDARDWHRTNGEAVLTLLSMALVVVAVLLWRPGRGPWWPIVAAVILFFAVGMQVGMGAEGNLEVHIPLGVALFGINVALSIYAVVLALRSHQR